MDHLNKVYSIYLKVMHGVVIHGRDVRLGDVRQGIDHLGGKYNERYYR